MFRTIIRVSLPLIKTTSTINSAKTTKARYMSSLIKTKYNEWYFKENDYYKIGLIDNMTEDISYIEVEEYNDFERDDIIISVENAKGINDIEPQFDCELLEINEEIIENLDILNNDLENTDTS